MAGTIIGAAVIRILPDSSGFAGKVRREMTSAAQASSKPFRDLGFNIRRSLTSAFSAGLASIGRMQTAAQSLSRFFARNFTIPIGIAIGAVVKLTTEFESGMLRVGALIGDFSGSIKDAGSDVGDLSVLARELGRTTQFTAVQATEAMQSFALAGFAKEEIESATEATLALAAAGGVDLKKSADITTAAIRAFNLTADDAARVANVMTQTFTSSNTDLTQLGEAFKFVAPVAASVGISFEETTAALGILSNAGLKASIAGTSLRGIITKLINPSEKAGKVIADLGVEVFDADGNMNSLVDIVKDFEGELGELDITFTEANGEMKDLTTVMEEMAVAGLDNAEAFSVLTGLDSQTFLEENAQAFEDLGIAVFDEGTGALRSFNAVMADSRENAATTTEVMQIFQQRAGPGMLALVSQGSGALEEMAQANRDAARATLENGIAQQVAQKQMSGLRGAFLLTKSALEGLAIEIGFSFNEGLNNSTRSVADFINVITDWVVANQEATATIVKWASALASLGPIFFIVGKALGALKTFLIFLTSPLQILMAAFVGLAFLFREMWQNSGVLRDALRETFDLIGRFVNPIIEIFTGLFGLASDGVSDFAQVLGDKLAGKILDINNKIRAFIEDGGLKDLVTNVALTVVAFKKWLDETKIVERVMELLGKAVEIVVEAFKTALPIVEGFFEALTSDAATTALLAFVKALDILMDAIKELLKILRPVTEFIGDHFVEALILMMVTMRLVKTQGLTFISFMKTLPAIAGQAVLRFGDMVAAGSARINSSFVGLAAQVEAAGARIARALQRLSTSPAITGMSVAIQRMSTGVANALQNLALRIRVAGTAIQSSLNRIVSFVQRTMTTMATIVRTATANISFMLGGFFAGISFAEADTAKDRIIALAAAIGTLGVAIAVAAPEVRLLTLALVGIATAIGFLIGNMEEGSEVTFDFADAFTELLLQSDGVIDLTNRIDFLQAAVNNLGDTEFRFVGEINSVRELADALEIGRDNAFHMGESLTNAGVAFRESTGEFVLSTDVADFGLELDDTTLSMGALLSALEQGPEAIEDFALPLINSLSNAQLEIDETAVRIERGLNGSLQAVNVETGETVREFSSLGAVFNLVNDDINEFQDPALLQFLVTLADDLGISQEAADALAGAYEEAAEAERQLEEDSKSLSDQLSELRSSIRQTRDELLGLANPDIARDIQATFDDMFDAAENAVKDFAFTTNEAGEQIRVDFDLSQMLTGTDETARGFRDFKNDITQDFAEIVVSSAAIAETPGQLEFLLGAAEERLGEFLLSLGLTQEEVNELVNLIKSESGADLEIDTLFALGDDARLELQQSLDAFEGEAPNLELTGGVDLQIDTTALEDMAFELRQLDGGAGVSEFEILSEGLDIPIHINVEPGEDPQEVARQKLAEIQRDFEVFAAALPLEIPFEVTPVPGFDEQFLIDPLLPGLPKIPIQIEPGQDPQVVAQQVIDDLEAFFTAIDNQPTIEMRLGVEGLTGVEAMDEINRKLREGELDLDDAAVRDWIAQNFGGLVGGGGGQIAQDVAEAALPTEDIDIPLSVDIPEESREQVATEATAIRDQAVTIIDEAGPIEIDVQLSGLTDDEEGSGALQGLSALTGAVSLLGVMIPVLAIVVGGLAFSFLAAGEAASFMALQVTSAIMGIIAMIGLLSITLLTMVGVMGALGTQIGRAFADPLAFAGNVVWPAFATVVNSAAGRFGIPGVPNLGPIVPTFHTGGVVGSGGRGKEIGDMTADERLAILQRGEGVLPLSAMRNLTEQQFEALRKGFPPESTLDPRDEIGGPFEEGQAFGHSNAALVGTSINPFDPNALSDEITSQGAALINSITGTFGNVVMAQVAQAAFNEMMAGMVEFIRGANEAINAIFIQKFANVAAWPVGTVFGGGEPDPDLSQEIDLIRQMQGQPNSFPALLTFLRATGTPFRVTSTLRNTLVRGTQTPSLHNTGRAVDLAEPGGPSFDSPGLLRIYNAFAPVAGMVRRIYSGPGGGGFGAVGSITWQDHHDHVHAALGNGAIIRQRMFAELGEEGDEVVIPLDDPRRALQLALASGLFDTIGQAVTPQAAPSPAPTAPVRRTSNVGDTGFDGGPLGGGPGNTYIINGISMEQVRAEVNARDEAVLRVRR